jgi:hypothetical protein
LKQKTSLEILLNNYDEELNEKAEKAYWEFDAMVKGYGRYRECPKTERDAFKLLFIAALND